MAAQERIRLSKGLRRRAAARHAARTWTLIAGKREAGWPYWRCADYLNHLGHATFSGKPWSIGRLSQIAPRGRTAITIFATEQRLGCDLTNSL